MTAASDAPAVLITGASTGIGAACALDLDGQGLRVFAGVRKPADGERLRGQASGRLSTVMLDVTDTAAIASALEVVAEGVGPAGLAGLVNNAGIIVPGPLEYLPTDRFRDQLEVNVLGTHAMCRACLPLLRQARGRIVILGSISGKVAPPYLGAYAASKHALEAVADALRVELRQWGIRVSIIEPDSVATPIWDKLQTAADDLDQRADPAIWRLYHEDLAKMRKAGRRLDRRAMPVDRVVAAVRHALLARRPKSRYPLGFRTRLATWSAGLIDERTRDWFMLRMMGIG